MNLDHEFVAALSVLAGLLAFVVVGAFILSAVQALFDQATKGLRADDRATARDALASYAPIFEGELAAGDEPRVEGFLRGEYIEIAYLEVSSLLVVKLWAWSRVPPFEVTPGWFGESWSGLGGPRVRELARGEVFAAHLARLWKRGWKSLSSEEGVLVLRGPCISALPDPEVVRRDLESLSRIGVICETGGLLRSEGQGARICPYCRDDLAEAPESACRECGTHMHEDCREENDGCVVFGCEELGQGRRREGSQPPQ